MTVRISGLAKRYGGEVALSGVNLEVADGEFLALLGPSGVGKTTLLRLIAGLDQPDSGSVLVDGDEVRTLSARDRRIGFVFQNYALFRHMSLARNIAFGLRVKPRRERPSREKIAARVEELLELMQLSGLGDRFPAQLSGGQRQRAALARALAIDPKVLLLDEPFGALDAKVRSELRLWLRELQQQLQLTSIFVTHDQHEAFQLADRIAILHAGRIVQLGSGADIRARPATPFVAEFLSAGAVPEIGFGDCAAARAGCCSKPSAARDVAIGPDRPLTPSPKSAGLVSSAEAVTTDVVTDPPCAFRIAPPAPPLGGKAARQHITGPLADLPPVGAGELWLIECRVAAELSGFERHALACANVIIYDRMLEEKVTATLPIGGYAEPSAGDDVGRCIRFIRDSWSVVRLVMHDPPGVVFSDLTRGLAARLRATGAASELRVDGLVNIDALGLQKIESRLVDIDALIGRVGNGPGRAIVFSALEQTSASRLYLVGSNGLAG